MLKNHVKTILFTLVMLFLMTVSLFSLFTFVKFSTRAFDITSENLDDSYGKLDTNTKVILENTLENFAEDENIPIYFSFVFENLNESYIKQFSKNNESVFIYYNDTTNELNVISNLLKNDSEFKVILSSKDDLSHVIPDFVNTVSENVKASRKTFYVNNVEAIIVLILVIFIATTLIFASFLEKYLKHLKRYFLKLKSHKNKKKEAEKVEPNEELVVIPLDQM